MTFTLSARSNGYSTMQTTFDKNFSECRGDLTQAKNYFEFPFCPVI